MKAMTSAALVLAVVAAFAGQPARAQLLLRKDVSSAQAFSIVQAAIAECRKTGSEITVAVVDRAGDPKLMSSPDNANPHNWELARRKAYTARTFRRSSLEFAQRSAPGAEQAGQRELQDVIALGGGVPIMVGTDVIGAVGVSGSNGGQAMDEACAKAGVAAIAAQLR
jgi:uncharacterized protein GlcG (DUF336 family)